MTLKATLTFNSFKDAKQFASAWAFKTLTGHDMTSVKQDGTVNVTVYNVDNAKKQFIEAYVSKQLEN